MANVPIKDGNAISKFLKATGLGSDENPYTPEHLESNSAAILAKLVEGLDITNHPIGGATEAKQNDAIVHLASLVAGIPTDPATSTLQSSVIAHLETLVAGVNVSNFPAAPTDPATGTLQSAAIAHLASLVAGIDNPVDVASIAIPGAIHHGQTVVVTPGTAVALALTQVLLGGVTIKALAGNTELIYVGATGVTSADGFELSAGEQIFLETSDLANIFLDAVVAGEGVSWVGG